MADTPSKLPAFVSWPSFPFEGQLRAKRLDPPVAEEPAREGEDPNTCTACSAPDDVYVWVSDRWRVRAMDRPSGLPMVLILESRSHLDLGDLTNLLAAELGVMTVRLERAIRSLDRVERVHVNRWGDGAAHLHLWFLARPTGQLQLRGSFLSLWDDIIEPISEELWRENLAAVAAWLEDFGGRAIAEPPRIVWHAPSSFAEAATSAAELAEAEAAAALSGAAAASSGAEAVSSGAASLEAQAESEGEPSKDGAEPKAGSPKAGLSKAELSKAEPVVEAPKSKAKQTTAEASAPDASGAGEPMAGGSTPDSNGRVEAAANGGAADARPASAEVIRSVAATGPDGLGGEGWLLSAEDVEGSDILTR